MKLKLEMDLDGAAVREAGAYEVARMLTATAERIEEQGIVDVGESRPLIDLNGNTVGRWSVG